MASPRRGAIPSKDGPLRQWVLKITAYAERLLNDLDLVDWPESLKKLANQLDRKKRRGEDRILKKRAMDEIYCLHHTPRYLFGATFMVLAPEHPLVATNHHASHKKQRCRISERSRRKKRFRSNRT